MASFNLAARTETYTTGGIPRSLVRSEGLGPVSLALTLLREGLLQFAKLCWSGAAQFSMTCNTNKITLFTDGQIYYSLN